MFLPLRLYSWALFIIPILPRPLFTKTKKPLPSLTVAINPAHHSAASLPPGCKDSLWGGGFVFGAVTHRDVGGEAGDERRGDGVRDGGVGTLGLLSRRGDDVEADEGVETGGCPLHHLHHKK